MDGDGQQQEASIPRWPDNYKKKHPERDYKKEGEWQKRPENVKDRVARNKARAMMEKEGRVHKGDGKEVDHKKFLGGKNGSDDNSKSNLRVVSRETNRKKQPKRK